MKDADLQLSDADNFMMASSSEVNVHVEEVVVVTTPDSLAQTSSSTEEKNILVASELEQSEEHNLEQAMDPETESSTPVSIHKEAVLVKISEDTEVEGDVLYPITCGDTKANLVWKKFVCPGINIKCVELNEHLISPKEFVYIAGKSTLKDWKRAIRLDGTMLSTKIDLLGTRGSLNSQQSTETTPATPASADVNGSSASFSAEVTDDATEWVTAIGEDTMTFWRGLKDAGMLEEVMEELQREIQEILKGLEERIHEPPLQVADATLLNNIVQNFGMLDLVKKVLASHKSQMDRCREQYTRSLVALEQQCDEHRKRAKELKSKSQHLNNFLMNMSPGSSPQNPKRPRLTRAVSGPATIAASPAQTTHFTVPITQISGIQLDKVISGYTVLASPAEAEGTSLVPTGSMGPTHVKVVSPYQLLTLPAATVQNLAVPAGGAAGGTVLAVPMNTASVEDAETEEEPSTETREELKE
ncbi:hypothetical protein DNTS_009201 [Danionella cerebrum]|uniref:SAND domain-containing protein n=1 Tax=Danionella cerebrum TaxID=2873325 RepID=A0A553MMT5_9TELE|nr:hypothetical protein DNTS_009201 [Danionella translucida]